MNRYDDNGDGQIEKEEFKDFSNWLSDFVT